MPDDSERSINGNPTPFLNLKADALQYGRPYRPGGTGRSRQGRTGRSAFGTFRFLWSCSPRLDHGREDEAERRVFDQLVNGFSTFGFTKADEFTLADEAEQHD